MQITIKSSFSRERGDARVEFPISLDELISDRLGAIYDPKRENAKINLHLDDRGIKGYLGTYFPRSFAESYTLYKEVLSHPALRFKVATSCSVSVLSLGCGTGGDIAGLLQAIHDFRPNVKKVRVIGIDGSTRALDYADFILREFADSLSLDLGFTIIRHTISDNQLTGFPVFDDKFDFVQSFKAAGELFAENICDKPYYRFAGKLLPCLNESGIFCLVDLTFKEKNLWLPYLLNQQISDFERTNSQYTTLLPISCGCWGKTCYQEQCYSQKVIKVTRGNAFSDESKIAYRILGRTSLKSCVNNVYDTTKKYRISSKNCCVYSASNYSSADNDSLGFYREIA